MINEDDDKDFQKQLDKLHYAQKKKLYRIKRLFYKKSREYSSEFDNRLKSKILKRDNYKCQLCFSDSDLTIHHIDYIKKNSDTKNLVTLCRACNIRVNTNRGYWKDYFKKLMYYRISRC